MRTSTAKSPVKTTAKADIKLSEIKVSDWQTLPEAMQLALAQQAMRRAAEIIADQADLFAVQFTSLTLQDRGAADALKLFGTLLRETSAECLRPMGNA